MKQKIDMSKKTAIDVYKLILAGKISRFPKGYWSNNNAKQNALELIRYLIEDVLKWNDEDVVRKLDKETFNKNKLWHMIKTVFGKNLYKAINTAYPNKFEPWEFEKINPNHKWNKQKGLRATKWLIEEKLKLSEDEIKSELTVNLFSRYGLRGMLQVAFNDSPYKAINSVYPNKFKPWEFRNVPNNYWNKETAREAFKWVFEEKLKWTKEEIENKARYTIFVENGLLGAWMVVYDQDTYKAMKDVYPDYDWSKLKLRKGK